MTVPLVAIVLTLGACGCGDSGDTNPAAGEGIVRTGYRQDGHRLGSRWRCSPLSRSASSPKSPPERSSSKRDRSLRRQTPVATFRPPAFVSSSTRRSSETIRCRTLPRCTPGHVTRAGRSLGAARFACGVFRHGAWRARPGTVAAQRATGSEVGPEGIMVAGDQLPPFAYTARVK